MPRRKPTGPRDRRGAPRPGQAGPREPTAQQTADYLERQRVVCRRKDRYASESEARAFALMHQPGPGSRADVYRCEICDGWHHTRGR
ncbi:MAG: hypothetical protein F2817_09555 [Actinobacteria bacterium]|nr:hypothetical protein [Actinomycetota bacterium]